MRAGVSLADLSTGLYSALAILTALFQRSQTGEGQYIDMALLDSTLSLLSFAAQSYLLDGNLPPRVGNGHSNIVPYGVFEAQDGLVIIAIGTDVQFEKFCQFVGREDLLSHPHFLHNKERVRNRHVVVQEMNRITREKPKSYWIEELERRDIPVGPVNTLKEAFENPQVQARKRDVTLSDGLKTVASPLSLSASPVSYNRRPPHLGEHTEEILGEFFSASQIKALQNKDII